LDPASNVTAVVGVINLQRARDAYSVERGIDRPGQPFAVEVIDNAQLAEAPAVTECV
jgi:hypothetical protein